MSRIGKTAIDIPDSVSCKLDDNVFTATSGSKTISQFIHKDIEVQVSEKSITVEPLNQKKTTKMLWGTTQRNLKNLIIGVTTGFTKVLEINGVGYRGQLSGRKLNLLLGFSHDVILDIPDGIDVECPKPTLVVIKGYDKQLVGSFAAKIRDYRRPEPYKGKGIKYENEYILRKEGKKK